jgi:hypothetical protein
MYKGFGKDQGIDWNGGFLYTKYKIALVANKTFLFHHLFNEDGEGLVEFFFLKTILSDGEVCTPCSPNIWKLIAYFKHRLGNKGYIDYILTL